MDNLTHSLVGALIGQAGLKRKTGLAMPALIIGANLPDVDAACFFWLEGVEHLGFRRGITHGPPALVLLPLILAGLLYGFDRWQARRGKRPEGRLPVSFKWLFLLSFIGCLTHPALDWLNVYGIRLLEPFSSRWFYGDTLFIIDVWLWALMGFAVWFSLRREKLGGEWMRPARLAIVVALGYIGLNGAISTNAARTESIGDWQDVGAEVISSPVPLVFWQREVIWGAPGYGYATKLYSPISGSSDERYIRNSCFLQNWDIQDAMESNSELKAYVYWTRTPVFEQAHDGSLVLRDARFYDPLARDRFSLALPDVQCEELPKP
ncbi:metal-dependent hydrolase [Erythrobacter sp. SDW2]|uniref:metal-dependent hydrolase n=1 Tax=Erythrobacter sp. SDW2 TaxID=2907154 RepID=UPI001F3732B8|nr:metal-dependent hydrolase [Erythrobacter sp. SDW2]UIP05612.1 metal-dependent hydrolase [Erythrobacter sp. SDW2]